MPRKKKDVTETIALKISQLMLNKQAEDIKIMDVREVTPITNFFINCSSGSHPQTKALSDYINDELKKDGVKPWHIEGLENQEWILMDYVNIVVNIFSKKSREYYNLERLWGDAVITEVKDEKTE
ncbi:MAG: ribosome silencing factor [Candidatus Marinimicrobia bacterium]|nr:ribosome silencing factor [Candidatus Neomarinimicrobiota bacterium]